MNFDNVLSNGGGGNGNGRDGNDIFSVAAAGELGPVPPGRYVVIAEQGGPKIAGTGSRGYEIRFRILDGEFAGRKLWKFFSYSEKAAPISQRDLRKFGFATMQQLESALPPERFVCELFVALRRDSAGRAVNDVKSVTVIRVEEPKADPFAPEGSA